MKKTLFFTLLCAASAAAAQDFSTTTMRKIALNEAYTLALAKSETLARQGEYIKQLDSAEQKLKAAFRPYLDFNASQYKQQNALSATKAYFSAGYSLFSGMRDYISLKAAGARTASAELGLKRAGQELYLDTAQAYLNLLHAQRQIFIRQEQMTVDGKRIAELQSRADIGRSRPSEVVAAKTQLAQDKTAYMEALLNERLAQEVLMFLTSLDENLTPLEIEPGKDEPISSYLKDALSRPDVEAERRNLDYYRYLSGIQDRNNRPTINLSADYYPVRNPAPVPTDRWDAGIYLNLPLYSGGALKAEKDSALSAKRSAELALKLAERQAGTDVKSAYEEFKYSMLEADSLKEALELAEENAKYQREDYKLGLVTNLDVLSAMNTVVQTRLTLSNARLQKNLSYIKLQIAAGREIK